MSVSFVTTKNPGPIELPPAQPNKDESPWSYDERVSLLRRLDSGVALPPEVIKALRLIYQKSLWRMAVELCDVPLHEIHRQVCDFFIAKDPSKPMKDQSEYRERLLLFPRFGWKTTIDALDAVNWIVCFPLVTIAIQTGDGDLADAIVGLIKSYFVVPGWTGERDADNQPVWNERAWPSKFHRLFPEHCITSMGKERGAADFFVTPARQDRKINPSTEHIKDPTVYAISIESNNSGWRCQVMKNDDILTDNNIRSSARVLAIDKRFHMSRKLLPWWGYRDTIGTRYENDDTYGRLMRKMGLGDEALYGNISVPDKRFKYLCFPSWWQKGSGPDGEGELKGKYFAPTLDSTEEQCEFLDKEIWPWQSMHDDLLMDAKSHSSQYLNNPVLASECDFTREGLLRCFVDWTQKPLNGKVFAIVDLAYSDKRGRDFTVIAVGLWYNEALWIIDIVRGRFKPEEMAEQIVGVIRDYPEIESMGIEESVGARWLKNDIFSAAERQGIVLPNIEWISLGQGERDAKENRIKGIVPLYKNGRFFILNNVRTEQEEIIREFTSSRAKKDVPDAISRFLKYQSLSVSPEDKQAKIDRRRQHREQDQFDMIFGQGRYTYVEPPTPVIEEEPESEVERDAVTGLPMGDFYGSRLY